MNIFINSLKYLYLIDYFYYFSDKTSFIYFTIFLNNFTAPLVSKLYLLEPPFFIILEPLII